MRIYFCPQCGRDLPARMGLFQLMYEDRIAACEVCNPPEPEDKEQPCSTESSPETSSPACSPG